MFAAIFAREPGPHPDARAEGARLVATLAPFKPPDNAGTWHDDRALIVHALHHNTPQSLHEHCPEVCRESGRIIASWARLDNRAELCATLGLQDRDTLTDPQIILAADARWPGDCARHLEGDFSFVIHDPANGRTYCARDGVGAKPFYYMDAGDRIIAASSVAAIRAVAHRELSPDRMWVALFATGFGFAEDETAYEGIAKLAPGHDLLITDGGQVVPRRYFDFDLAAPHAGRRDPRWVDRYRDEFDRAVDVRTRSAFLVGSESSAGLDSASIVGRLVQSLPHDRADFHTFALVAHQREHELLEQLSAMCGVAHTHKIVRLEMLRIDDAVARAHKVIGHPPEHGQPLLNADFFAQAQGMGIRTMMSGFGGDEIATGYAKHLVHELLARGDYRALIGELEGAMPLRLARLAKWRWRGLPHPDRAAERMIATKLDVACLSREFCEDTGLRRRIERWMMPDRGPLTLNTVAALDPGFRHVRAGRLESSALFASSYGIEYRFPLLDRRLIQFFLGVPSIEKRSKSMGRYLHRRAMAGRIPDDIVWQDSKDMGPPLGGRVATQRQPRLAFEELPTILQEMLDADAFEKLQAEYVDSEGSTSHRIMRTEYFLWQIRQICAWLSN